MGIQEEILRIQAARDTLRNKAVELKISSGTEKIDELAEDYDAIVNQGSLTAKVKEGETYTIPKGYHDGTGTVSGVAGGGNYTLQSKQITPTKKPQQVTPDEGYYGMSDVTVQAIPTQYQDVSSVTATAEDVLATKIIVNKEGSQIAGSMLNNGAVSKSLDTTTTSYVIPKGYHNGEGSVSVTLEEKSAVPTEEEQEIVPTPGKVISKVTVSAIPGNYIKTDDANAEAVDIIVGKTAYVNGSKVTGSMPNNEAVNKTLDIDNASFAIPKGYHDGMGVAKIIPETKTATPTKSQQTIKATSGKVISSVTIDPIPEEYIDTTDSNATAAQILSGSTAYVAGSKVTGTMKNNGAASGTIDGLTGTSFTIPAGYHNGSGKVNLTSAIEDALALI